MSKRRHYNAEFKLQVALEVAKSLHFSLFLLVLVVVTGCGTVPDSPVQDSSPTNLAGPISHPTVTSAPRPTWTLQPESTQTPEFLPTPPVTPPMSPSAQPTPYIAEETLPTDFPVLAYTAHNIVWTLHYTGGLLQERFLAGPVEWGNPYKMVLSPQGRYLALNTEYAEEGLLWLYIVGLDGSVRPLGYPRHYGETVFHAWSPDESEVLVSFGWHGGGLLRTDGSDFRGMSSVDCGMQGGLQGEIVVLP